MAEPADESALEPSLESAGPVSIAPSTAFAVALLSELVRLGVRDVVVAPGSRSQALALAAAEFERAGLLHLHVRIDERTAGFLALGLAVESRRPAVVIVTSGTAVANLHPAVLEAHHSGVPLIVCSADRPAELRGIRANQTTMQPGIFAGAVRLERDVPAPGAGRVETTLLADESDGAAAVARAGYGAAMGFDEHGEFAPAPGPGPVHLNLQFREPLSSVFGAEALAGLVRAGDAGGGVAPGAAGLETGLRTGFGASPRSADASAEPRTILPRGPRTLVVAGAGAGPDAEALAREGGWPLVAEVSSGARFGPNLVVAYRELLRDADFGGLVERVVVFGHPTLSREVPALVQRPDVETVIVSPSGIEWYDPGRDADRFERAVGVQAVPLTPEERAWVGRWVHTSRALLAEGVVEPAAVRSGVDETGHVTDFAAQRGFLKAQLDRVREPVDRRMLAEAVWAATWPHDRLVLGASRLIRDVDRVVPGRRIDVHANRGLAGIDGTIATALGVAIASQRAAGGVASPAADGAGPSATDAASARAATGTTRVLLGDLTFLHDVGSLLIGAGEVRPRIQLIVGNDGGGTIFDSLEVAGTAAPDAFDRVQLTPQQVDLGGIAEAYGWTYARVTTRGELEQALGTAVAGPSILEVPLPR